SPAGRLRLRPRGDTAWDHPRITEERPVIDAIDGWNGTRDRRQCPPLARREPHELLRILPVRLSRLLDLWTTGPALTALSLPRPLGVQLGLALIFFAATVAAVHPRSFLLSHRTPACLAYLRAVSATTPHRGRRGAWPGPRARATRSAPPPTGPRPESGPCV